MLGSSRGEIGNAATHAQVLGDLLAYLQQAKPWLVSLEHVTVLSEVDPSAACKRTAPTRCGSATNFPSSDTRSHCCGFVARPCGARAPLLLSDAEGARLASPKVVGAEARDHMQLEPFTVKQLLVDDDAGSVAALEALLGDGRFATLAASAAGGRAGPCRHRPFGAMAGNVFSGFELGPVLCARCAMARVGLLQRTLTAPSPEPLDADCASRTRSTPRATPQRA